MEAEPIYDAPRIARRTAVAPELIGEVGSEVVCAVFGNGGDGGAGGSGG